MKQAELIRNMEHTKLEELLMSQKHFSSSKKLIVKQIATSASTNPCVCGSQAFEVIEVL